MTAGVEMAKTNAELLGYGSKNEESFKISGTRKFNYDLSPSQKPEFEVIETKAKDIESEENEKK